MKKLSAVLLALVGVFALGSSAIAARNAGCALNDKIVPENTTACKGNEMQVCENGQWRRVGSSAPGTVPANPIKCSR